eukprot:TRINITY_DN2911_c0_g1_i4.p1 TRINITY_DN2911_c0_g1~~TRINITY_DN2911_c0_g1_i4.p1  ORF type:complete len:269 (-),score=68.20 TRINITY_DN2911_c0_g1_i4:1794-2600(-)
MNHLTHLTLLLTLITLTSSHITTTHPTFSVTSWSCQPDWTQLPSTTTNTTDLVRRRQVTVTDLPVVDLSRNWNGSIFCQQQAGVIVQTPAQLYGNQTLRHICDIYGYQQVLGFCETGEEKEEGEGKGVKWEKAERIMIPVLPNASYHGGIIWDAEHRYELSARKTVFHAGTPRVYNQSRVFNQPTRFHRFDREGGLFDKLIVIPEVHGTHFWHFIVEQCGHIGWIVDVLREDKEMRLVVTQGTESMMPWKELCVDEKQVIRDDWAHTV